MLTVRTPRRPCTPRVDGIHSMPTPLPPSLQPPPRHTDPYSTFSITSNIAPATPTAIPAPRTLKLSAMGMQLGAIAETWAAPPRPPTTGHPQPRPPQPHPSAPGGGDTRRWHGPWLRRRSTPWPSRPAGISGAAAATAATAPPDTRRRRRGDDEQKPTWAVQPARPMVAGGSVTIMGVGRREKAPVGREDAVGGRHQRGDAVATPVAPRRAAARQCRTANGLPSTVLPRRVPRGGQAQAPLQPLSRSVPQADTRARSTADKKPEVTPPPHDRSPHQQMATSRPSETPPPRARTPHRDARGCRGATARPRPRTYRAPSRHTTAACPVDRATDRGGSSKACDPAGVVASQEAARAP